MSENRDIFFPSSYTILQNYITLAAKIYTKRLSHNHGTVQYFINYSIIILTGRSFLITAVAKTLLNMHDCKFTEYLNGQKSGQATKIATL